VSFRIGVVMLVGLGGVAHAKDRVLLSASAKALTTTSHVKAGASCKVAVTTAEPGACPVACKASVTCGATVLDAGDATCAPPDGSSLDCPVAYKRRVWTARGLTGQIDVADGLAMMGDGDDAALFAFPGGRAGGDPEGKPKAKLRETRTPSVDGPLAIAARTCTVELATYPDPYDVAPCETKCLAKVTCGAVHVSRAGTCTVPYFYESDGGKCYGDVEALAFDDGNGATVTLGPRPEDKAPGVFPLFAIATLTLSP
jgi:hypothetical protein